MFDEDDEDERDTVSAMPALGRARDQLLGDLSRMLGAQSAASKTAGATRVRQSSSEAFGELHELLGVQEGRARLKLRHEGVHATRLPTRRHSMFPGDDFLS